MTGRSGLRVLVCDDQELVQWGLRALLSRQSWVARCVPASCGDQACELAVQYDIHVAVVDLFIDGESGIDVCRRLRQASPRTRVLLQSGSGRASTATARAAGASGFIAKQRPVEQLLEAVAAVGSGRSFFDGSLPRRRTALSREELHVLGLMADGATNREIAAQLMLSPETVKARAARLYRKLEARNRAQAVRNAQLIGAIE